VLGQWTEWCRRRVFFASGARQGWPPSAMRAFSVRRWPMHDIWALWWGLGKGEVGGSPARPLTADFARHCLLAPPAPPRLFLWGRGRRKRLSGRLTCASCVDFWGTRANAGYAAPPRGLWRLASWASCAFVRETETDKCRASVARGTLAIMGSALCYRWGR